jgi:hypothetical protein
LSDFHFHFHFHVHFHLRFRFRSLSRLRERVGVRVLEAGLEYDHTHSHMPEMNSIFGPPLLFTLFALTLLLATAAWLVGPQMLAAVRRQRIRPNGAASCASACRLTPNCRPTCNCN